jgi:hypothetical protein
MERFTCKKCGKKVTHNKENEVGREMCNECQWKENKRK